MTQGRRRSAKGPRGEVRVLFPAAVLEYLEGAARRRSMTADELAMEIVGGVLTRGSVDKALRQWADYRCGYEGVGDDD